MRGKKKRLRRANDRRLRAQTRGCDAGDGLEDCPYTVPENSSVATSPTPVSDKKCSPSFIRGKITTTYLTIKSFFTDLIP